MEDKTHVLLVDDEKDFLDPISFWLKSKGYLVTVANNGQSAVDLVRTNRPDIIFMDVNMPIMNGIEALACIRKFDKEVPVIIITAYGDKKNMDKVNQLGVSGFFPKKADLAQFVDVLETTLRTHKKL